MDFPENGTAQSMKRETTVKFSIKTVRAVQKRAIFWWCADVHVISI